MMLWKTELSSWDRVKPNQVYEVACLSREMKREPPVAGQHDLGPGEPGSQRKVEQPL